MEITAPKTISAKKVDKEHCQQLPIPSVGLKYGVAKPLFDPYSIVKKGIEYNIAFAMRPAGWKGDTQIGGSKYIGKQDVLHMWFLLNDETYFYWSRFHPIGTILISTAFVRPDVGDASWEMTQAPRQVLIEKASILPKDTFYVDK
jgi:hypothetical protein